MVSDQLQFMSEYIIYQFHSVDMFEAKIDHLSNYIIRPRRRQYAINDLGPTVFKTQYCLCTRQDFSVQFQYGSTYGYPEHCDSKNESKQKKTVKLQCSIFIPHCSSIAEHKNKLNSPKHFAQKDKAYRNNQTHSFISSERACVLSMHGNTGTRVSTLSNLQPVLKFGIAFACFDFAGCGLSQGDYVTLGYYQKYQISAVLEHIYKKYGYHKFMLYGRSMGAASSLFYSCLVYPEYVENKQKKIKEYYQIEQQLHRKLKKDSIELELDVLHKLNIGHFGYQVIGIILDSPYYDIKEMVMDLVKSKIWFVPKPLISYAIGKVSQRVKQKLTSVGITSMKERSLNEECKNKIEEQKKQQEFCLLKSTTISEMATIPFPVFVLYGLKDDVILRQHTLELFNRLATINKKLHVLQDQGHGDHRDQKVKIDALEWVLGFQYERVDKRIQRDAQMIGIDVEQYTNWIFSHETEKEQKMIAKTAEKTKQIGSELTTQRTTSITSFKIGQVHVGYGGFGSLTSLDNYNPVQQQRKQEIVKKKTKEISSIELLQMSRIAPYQALLKKMGITTSNKLTKIRDKVNSNSAMKEEQINQIEICREPKQLDGSIEYVR